MSGAAVGVDTTSPVPPYEQIRAQRAALITTGRPAEGERLPTVRQPAAGLGPAAGTVARAYRELESAALIRTRRGGGTRVAPLPAPVPRPGPAEPAALARRFVAEARALGAAERELLEAVRGALRE
ncbi:GntR family transcriptional regulator [Streptomyces sp. NPDC051636]|uniref:GntR family transcriptional regulator n=1 Tax=Streptomyces sp. NPDC051636 TaxID=3365663 RepID=UPI003795A53E